MKLPVARPRVLALVLGLLIAGGVAVTAVAVDQNRDSGGVPTDVEFVPAGGNAPDGVEVTPELLDDAWSVVEADGRLSNLANSDTFTERDVRAERTTDGRTLVAFDAVWDSPVSSSGPWLELECQRTVSVNTVATWHDLRSVSVLVDLSSGEVVEFAPSTVANELGGTLDNSSISTDWDGECPEGTNDD